MDKRKLGVVSVILSVFVVSVLVMGAVPIGALADDEGTRADLVLRVGAQDDTKTKNIFGATDVWSMNVLGPVYEGVGQEDPATWLPIPYLLKGIDADGDGTFDLDEYGVYDKESDPLEVTAYYDFNGIYSHDGVQMTMDDLLFGYHINALDPLVISLDVLKDKNNLPGSNYSTTRWLRIWPVNDVWDNAIPVGPDTALTFALHLSQYQAYANFKKYTLNGATVYPKHIWEGTGKICLDATAGVCSSWKENIHDDFGYAYDPVTHNGVPQPDSYEYSEAEQWSPADDEVIGTGAFEFDNWSPGVSALLNKYEDYYASALDCERVGTPPVCQGTWFSYMHQPTIDGMLFKIYKTAQAAVFALQAGEIEVVSWSVPPEFVGGLLVDPNVGISSNAEKGFFYLSYNMRRSPFGYPNNDPSQGDDGIWLRKAMALVIDKKTIVTTLLQNFGVAGDQPVSPAFTKWYNASVTKYEYDLAAAGQMLDDHYTESFQGGPGLGWSGGYRNLPTIGDREVEILCPQADYDPIRASACNMIASNARDVGLNIVAKLMAFGEIVDRLDNREMDMWVLGWRIGSDPPDYYHAFFYSGNAPAGQNYGGFQNETFDDLIIQARAELNPDAQATLIKQCSGLLMEAVPYDVLYFRTNIEAYRADRFINWTVGEAGSIFGASFWSRIGIHAPSPDALTISPPVLKSAVASDSTESVVATVRDPDGNTISDAPVQMTLTGSGDLGNLSIPLGESGTTVNGTTNINGQLLVNYIAPTVETVTEVFVSAQALDFGTYPASSMQFSRVKVQPPGTQFLSVLHEPSFFALEEGDAMPIDVTVTDQDGFAVEGASVNLTTIPSGPTLTPDHGITDSVGTIGTVVFTAPAELAGDVESQSFDLIVNVTLAGYILALDTKEITVLSPTAGGGGGGTETEVPALDVVATIAVIALVAVSFAVFRGTKRR
ncbi:MAG: ABC transporter substrate-binding protein [Candidatus Thermoplasmatota archaeon]|nr:ABC transporter substrate-binding protein [Candidatus Thermoplasmatota archaeon]